MPSINSISEEARMANAKAMGEDFARLRGGELLQMFLCETLIVDDYYNDYKLSSDMIKESKDFLEPQAFLDVLKKDYQEAFNRFVQTAYAMGYMDHAEHISTRTYKQKKPKAQQGEQPLQLTLPGLSD